MARKQNQVKICLWTHVQNEAPIIEEMLSSVVDYIDYWVLVDNGSTDGTQKIIEDFFQREGIPGKLYQSKIGWKGHGINRQHSWDFLCETDHGCDYILRQDADEALAVDEDFDWSLINDPVSHNIIYKSGDYITPRTWLWNFNKGFYWQDDEAHETIHCQDGTPLSQQCLPYSFHQFSLEKKGNSYEDPLKFLKDVYKLEVQLHERLAQGSTIQDEFYHLLYLCKSFVFTGYGLDQSWCFQYFPYGKETVEHFLRRGIYYYDQLIKHFGPEWSYFYYRSFLQNRVDDEERRIEDLISAHLLAPHRAEPLWDLYLLYKNHDNVEKMIEWGGLLLRIELDLALDNFEVHLPAYPSHNKELKAELSELLGVDTYTKKEKPKNPIFYDYRIAPQSSGTIRFY